MNPFLLGKNLENQPGELSVLVDRVTAGKLAAKKVDAQTDGDVRYWEVDTTQSPLLGRLIEFAESHFREAMGRPPERSFIMINLIDATKSPRGSGGGWHRDSFRTQYKALVYLTDVLSEQQGAFCLVPASNGLAFRFVSAAYWFFTRGNRYSDRLMNALFSFGLGRQVVLQSAGVPFFVNTSLVHRGMPIKVGKRVAATVYMFDRGETQAY